MCTGRLIWLSALCKGLGYLDIWLDVMFCNIHMLEMKDINSALCNRNLSSCQPALYYCHPAGGPGTPRFSVCAIKGESQLFSGNPPILGHHFLHSAEDRIFKNELGLNGKFLQQVPVSKHSR